MKFLVQTSIDIVDTIPITYLERCLERIDNVQVDQEMKVKARSLLSLVVNQETVVFSENR
jgi:hypothetical protein